MAGKDFHCQLCNCVLHTKKEFDQHCRGKKHTGKNHTFKLFVRGFKDIKDPQMFLHSYFSKFGNVSNISLGGKPGNVYAIVEFREPESLSRALNVRHRIGVQVLYVQPYKCRPNSSEHTKMIHQELEQSEKMKQAQTRNHIMEMLLSAENLTDQFHLVAEGSKLDPNDQRARARICEELTKLFAPHFENSRVFQFGSSVNGFGVKGCDLDLFLDVSSDGLTSDLKKNKIKKLAQIVSASTSFSKTLTIPSKRCPVLRFVHKATEIKCDLSINNRKALHNSYLLRLYSSDPRVHKLVSIVRLWARSQGLAGSSGGAHLFTSYAITLIVLFFVMHRKPQIIPLVCDVEKCIKGTYEEVVEDWECLCVPRDAKLPPSENEETDLDLVKEFFAFFSGSINWDSDALVVKDATVIPRVKISQDPIYIGCKEGHMTVLDPFVLTHNVVTNVNEATKIRFVAELKRAADLTRDWPASANKSGSNPWGIAELLVPSPVPKSDIPGKKSGLKATQAVAAGQAKSDHAAKGAGISVKKNATHIEGEQKNGEFYIAVQPLSQTISSAKLLLTAKQNNLRPAEQWCIMAQDLILDVLKTVFVVEVEEVDLMEAEGKEKQFEDVHLLRQPGDLAGDVCMKDENNITDEENLGCTVTEYVRVDETESGDGSRIKAGMVKDEGFEAASCKRTSDAAHLDSTGIELVDNSTADYNSQLDDTLQNPKKKFCDIVSREASHSSEVMAVSQVVDKSVSDVDAGDAVDKCVVGERNIDCCIETVGNSRTGLDWQDANAVSSGNRDHASGGSEASPESSAAAGSSVVTQDSSSHMQIGSTTFSGAMSEIRTSKIVSYFCRCKHQVWIGRKKLYSQLSHRQTLTGLALEQEVTNLALRQQKIPPNRVREADCSPCQGQLEGQNRGAECVSGRSSPGKTVKGQNNKNPAKDHKISEEKEGPSVIRSGQGPQSTAEAENCHEKAGKEQLQEIEFLCQIFHQNCDADFKLPHILIKMRPSESSRKQFKNFYSAFRSHVLNLVTQHFLEIYN